jgi:hypothetical protein
MEAPAMWHLADGQAAVLESDASLRSRIAEGLVDPATLVWRPGMLAWQPAGDVPGLFTPPPISPTVPTDDQVAAQSPHATETARQPNYIVRHWRGDLSLGVSYWINGILLSTIVAVPAIIMASADITEYPRLILAGLASLFLLGILLSVWQYVGIWRSAGRSMRDRQRRLKWLSWAGLARVVTSVSFLSVSFNTVHQLPGFAAMVQIAIGDDPTPHHVLRVLNNGKEILLAGGIDFGTTADLADLLEASPGVATMDFDNIGGRVAEARHVGEIISRRHLATYTAASCLSACTIAYISGSPRYLGPDGKLGFHRYSFPGLTPDQEHEINRQGEHDLVAAGVAADFAAKVFATAADHVWYPDAATLLAAHVVTRLTDGMAFSAAAGGQNVSTTRDAERVFGMSPSFVALKRWEPVSYAKAMDTAVEAMRAGKSLHDLTVDTRKPIVAAVAKYRRVAGDDVQVRAARLASEEAKILAPDHPAECVAMWYGTASAGQRLYMLLLPQELRIRDNELSAAIINAGASDPSSSVVTPPVAAAVLKQLTLRIRDTAGVDPSGLSTTSAKPEDQRRLCLALAAILDAISALPPPEAGALMRYLFTAAK